jgi:hypothetical protein
MQIVVEGLALYSFREMRNLTEEPLLKDLLTYVARDESRHHAYGVQYISRCVPCLNDAQRRELEDFALEAARTLIGSRTQQTFFSSLLAIWSEVGIDPAALLSSVHQEREQIMRDIRPGGLLPTLRRCGLLSERVAQHFHSLLRENFSGRVVGEDVQQFLELLPDIPEDPAAWVLGQLD